VEPSPRARGPRPQAVRDIDTEEGGETASKAVVFLLFMGITLTTYTFAMTQNSSPSVANNTILVVDNITSIFLAVLWFQGVDDLTNALPEGHHQVLAAALHAVILLSVAFMIAWSIKRNGNGLAWFCGAAAHYCAFASVHAGSTVQDVAFSWSIFACIAGLVLVFAALCLLGGVMYFAKRALGLKPGEESDDEGENAFVDRFDDVEQDFAAVCMAAYWTMVVRFVIVGRYPEHDEIEPGARVDHTAFDRNMMLMYTCIAAVVAVLFVAIKLPDLSYPMQRVIGLLKAFCSLCVAFGFLFWGKMYFYEQPYFNVIPIMARLYFAGLCSVIAMVGIVILAGLKAVPGGGLTVGLATLGLVAGVAWEEVFDASIEAEVEGTAHETAGKLFIAIVASAIILPVHGMYLKPLALEAEEALEGETK
jgi:hypothetical protein